MVQGMVDGPNPDAGFGFVAVAETLMSFYLTSLSRPGITGAWRTVDWLEFGIAGGAKSPQGEYINLV